MWQKVKVLSRPWALGFQSELIRPLKWGTLGSQTSGGSKNTSHQSWKKKIKLWRLVFLEPPGVREPNVPHFKGLIISDWNSRAQVREITFTLCQALLKRPFYSYKQHLSRLFWTPLYFYDFWPELQMASSNEGDRIFDWQLLSILFTTYTIGISGLIWNLRTMGLT